MGEINNTQINWDVVHNLYDVNFVCNKDKSDVKIPKLIHQIWLGDKPYNEYLKFMESWQDKHPGWGYKLWTDKDVNDVEIPNRKLFDTIKNVGQKSDFLRYHILNQFGGIYVDTDFECIKSLDDLLYLDFFTGVGYPKVLELYIGIIASVPGHKIIKNIVENMVTIMDKGWRQIFATTGSYFFTRMFLDSVKEYMPGVVAFPTEFFYPYPVYMHGKEGLNPHAFIVENTYALHHWATSWIKK
jgi:inositol phosphorylceramide mannosyltransferase catalytic subunit